MVQTQYHAFSSRKMARGDESPFRNNGGCQFRFSSVHTGYEIILVIFGEDCHTGIIFDLEGNEGGSSPPCGVRFLRYFRPGTKIVHDGIGSRDPR